MDNNDLWSTCSDEELVFTIQNGNKEAFLELYKRYNGLFYTVSYSFMNNYHIPHLYLDDFISVATDSLLLAVNKFQSSENRFVSFWWSITITKFKNYYAKNTSIQLACAEESFLDKQRNKLQDVEPSKEYELDPLNEDMIATINNNIKKFTKDEIVYLQFAFIGYSPLEIGKIIEWKKSKLFRIRRNALSKLNMIKKSN